MRPPFTSISALFAAFALLGAGCDLTKFTADTTAGVFEEAAPAINEHWDYELAGEAAPGSIMQLEGLHRVTPDNEIIIIQLARAYTGYAYGWIEDEIETTDPLDFERIEHLQHRARLMYLRARNLAFRLIRLNHDGFDEARQGGLDDLERWLQEETTDPEDAEALLFAGYAWGSAINVSREDPMMIADLGFAKALVERSIELDDTVFNGAGVTFMAVVNASFPEALGGNPERGRELFERSLQMNDREFLLTQYNYARTYAVTTGNRELFEELLREVIEHGDVAEHRLPNKIARRRAYRLLGQADEFFY